MQSVETVKCATNEKVEQKTNIFGNACVANDACAANLYFEELLWHETH